ncbi:MAG TPA: hypothetical protein VGA69_02715 [Nitriliruptorales bacterium]
MHIVLSAEERARYRAAAQVEGESLSEWVRNAARARLATSEPDRLASVEDLDAFFARCDERCDEGADDQPEPDWDEHLAVIEGSRRLVAPS